MRFRYIILVATLSLLAGCGSCSRGKANLLGYSRVCVAGVSYLQFPSGVVAQIDINGKPIGCDDGGHDD